jgi:kelch-like protein 17 (actinfilin)
MYIYILCMYIGARASFGLTAAEDSLFALGGCDGEVVLDTVESWDIRGTGAWRTEAPLQLARANLGACCVGERLYAVGGWDGSRDLAIVESFSLASRTWREEAELSIPRSNLAIAVLSR